MAGTYYKYAERQADSYVNWAEIGSNMSSMLVEENKIREDKKAYLDEQTRKNLIEINKIPEGSDVSAKAAALELADNASKFLLMQEKEFKAGRLKTKDYLTGRQNTMDDIGASFDTLEAYQKVFGEKMQRGIDGISSQGEMLQMANVEGYGNWKESGFIFDPATGRVMAAKRDKKGVLDPTTAVSLNHLNSLIQEKWDKANVDADLEKVVKSFGTYINDIQTTAGTTGKQGVVTTKEGIMNSSDFATYENQLIQAQLANPYYAGSVLFDYVDKDASGKDYYLTNDKSDTDPAAIHQDGTNIVLTAEQEKAATEYLRMRARTMYDSKTTVKVGSQVQRQDRDSDYTRAEKKKQSELYAENMVKIMLGDDNESSDGANFFKTKTGNQFTKTVGDGGKFTVINSEGQTVSFNLSDDPIKIAQSLIGALGVDEKIVSESQVVERVKQLLKGKQTNTTSSFDTGAVKETDYTPNVTAINDALGYGEDGILIDNAETTVQNLNNLYKGLGFTITAKNTGVLGQNNYAVFTNESGVATEFEISTPQDDDIKGQISSYIENNFSAKKAATKFAPTE
jgi:hypothetical protein